MPEDNHVILSNPMNGYTEEIKVGFSWTFFFFHMFVPLFRQDWKWFLLVTGAWLLTSFIHGEPDWVSIVNFAIGWGLSFFYNRIYINERLKKGWYPADDTSKERLKQANFIVTKKENE